MAVIASMSAGYLLVTLWLSIYYPIPISLAFPIKLHLLLPLLSRTAGTSTTSTILQQPLTTTTTTAVTFTNTLDPSCEHANITCGWAERSWL